MSIRLDASDLRILARLQRDCRQSVAEIADAVGMSKSSCHRRIQALEAAGVLQRFTATLDPSALGFRLFFMVDVRLSSQSDEVIRAFEKGVLAIPEVLECQLMSGQIDYLLRVAAKDVEDYERIHLKMTRLPGVATIVSNLALRTVKPWAGLPI